MSNEIHIQTNFLNMVKEKSNQHLAFVDELADLLGISRDSSYRRLRGETLLSFEEIGKISDHYKVSIDSFLSNGSSPSVAFQSRSFDANTDFRKYQSSIRDHLELVNKFPNKKMIYSAKDIPPMHYYQFPRLTWFKMYFWQKTILNHNAEKSTFDLETPDEELIRICHEIWNQFMTVPSTEIWSDETVNITLRQIEYYHDINALKQAHALALVDELMTLIKHIRMEASEGKKMHLSAPASGVLNSYQLYFNEIAIGDNTALFEMNNQQTVFITYNMLNVLSTSDVVFCQNIEKYLNSILQKSTLISITAEKERNRFFNRMEAKIEGLGRKISGQF